MSKLDDDIRKALADEDASYDLDREQGVFRQMAGLFQGKMRWMAICVTIETVVCMVLLVLVAIEFFQTEEIKWQLFYATSIVLLAMLLLLIKLWGWMQMMRYSIQRELKRLELRILELGKPGRE